jgi:hypothetical protein
MPSTGAKRSPQQRERDLELISEGVVEGLTQIEITGRLNALRSPDGYTLTPQQISRDVQLLVQRWRKQGMVNLEAARDRQIAELRQVRRVAWAEWRRSGEEKQSTETEISTSGNPDPTAPPAAQRQRARSRKEGRLRDPRYLEAILRSLEKEARLLGLDAIDQGQLDVLQREAEKLARDLDLSVEDVMSEADRILKRGTR